MRRKLILAALLLAAGLVAFRALQRPEKGLESSRPTQTDSEVRALAATAYGMPLVLSEAGVLEGWREVDVVAEVAGRVVAPPVEVGTDVGAGSGLVRLDDKRLDIELRSRQAAVRQAELALDVARREVRRLQPLREQGVVSETAWRTVDDTVWQAEASLAAAEAARDATLEALADSRVRAPFAGRVVRRLTELGAFVAAGRPVARLVDLSRLRLRIGAPARLAVLLEPGMPAELGVDAYPGELFSARVHSVSAAADSSGLFPVELAIEGGGDRTLLPGMVARASVVAGHRQPRLLVPLSALERRNGGDAVFVVVGDAPRVELRRVSLGARNGGVVEVVGGLEPGERVVYDGHAGLDEGDRVRVLEGAEGLPPELEAALQASSREHGPVVTGLPGS